MKTFYVQTLGCKVNQYESEQVAAMLRARGLIQTAADKADLRIVNTCSVTLQAASQSRQTVRQVTRSDPCGQSTSDPSSRRRVLVIGCWATSDKPEASAMPGVDAVLTHHDDLAAELDRLLELWTTSHACAPAPPRPMILEGFIQNAGAAADIRTPTNKAESDENVNENSLASSRQAPRAVANGTRSVPATLPLLGEHQTGRQRAFLKIQDGCDAHCTYCIIPQLRPSLWSKPVDDVIEEARRLVACGHVEIVLTGIFLGAYGQETALRRRQAKGAVSPLARLVEALCKNVPGLKRLRLSSLEPGDLSHELLAVLASFPQVVPHFHLPLQSGSDAILRRMNRQYSRDDFMRMVDQVNEAFDRPALTTDIIVGFPGESDDEFARTLEVVERTRFIHIHAFPYSPRPGTAASRWKERFVHQQTAKDRIALLALRANEHGFHFRQQFIGQTVEVIAERGHASESDLLRHGRCERYFSVLFRGAEFQPGDAVRLRIDRVTPTSTYGEVVP